jgi:hypothetical protein
VHEPAFFHPFFCNVHQRYKERAEEGSLVARPYFKEDAGTGVEQSPGYHPLMDSRNDTAGDLSGSCQTTVQTPISGVYLSPKKV